MGDNPVAINNNNNNNNKISVRTDVVQLLADISSIFVSNAST
jgi:hypothetical protein